MARGHNSVSRRAIPFTGHHTLHTARTKLRGGARGPGALDLAGHGRGHRTCPPGLPARPSPAPAARRRARRHARRRALAASRRTPAPPAARRSRRGRLRALRHDARHEKLYLRHAHPRPHRTSGRCGPRHRLDERPHPCRLCRAGRCRREHRPERHGAGRHDHLDHRLGHRRAPREHCQHPRAPLHARRQHAHRRPARTGRAARRTL